MPSRYLTYIGLLLIGPLKTNFSEILIKMQQFSFNKINLTIPSTKWRSFCFGLNILRGFRFDLLFAVSQPSQNVKPGLKLYFLTKLNGLFAKQLHILHLFVHWVPGPFSLQWRHAERNSVSNHRYLDCLLNRQAHITGLCEWGIHRWISLTKDQ